MNCDAVCNSNEQNSGFSGIQNPVLESILKTVASEAVQSYDQNGCYVWGCTNVWHKDYHDG